MHVYIYQNIYVQFQYIYITYVCFVHTYTYVWIFFQILLNALLYLFTEDKLYLKHVSRSIGIT